MGLAGQGIKYVVASTILKLGSDGHREVLGLTCNNLEEGEAWIKAGT